MATFTTKVLSGITAIGATGGGYYSASTNSNFSAYGVAWNTGATPTIANPHTVNGSGTGKTFNWSSTLTGLTPNTLYYVRAYVTSGGTTAYADGTITGRTLVALPTVITTSLTSIMPTTASGGGNVTNAGGGTITARGVAYGTSSNPTTSGNHTVNGTGTGVFVSSLTGLTPNTLYYIRAYATNSVGTAYGTQVTGKTLIAFALTGITVSGITDTTVVGVGEVTSEGGETIHQIGFRVWTVNPSVYTAFTCTYPGVGKIFRCPIIGLASNDSYTAEVFASGNTVHTEGGISFVTALHAPKIGKIIQPASANETGSVSFIDLFNDNSILMWTGTATGSTAPFADTGITITGLTIGTYYFSIKLSTSAIDSPLTTVIIKSPSVVPTEFTSTGYDLYYKTGIGDGPALAAYLLWLDAESVIHEEP